MTNTIGNANGGASIHILLQGKGGVGKSLISAVLSQYFRRLRCVRCLSSEYPLIRPQS